MGKAPYGYKLHSPKSLLGKMDRELARVQKDKKWQSDHAFNFAVTAWHMTDWLWHYAEETNPGQREYFGRTNKKRFQNFVRGESKALDICMDLANGAKHFHVSRQTKVALSADVSAKEIQGGSLGSFVLDVDQLGGTIQVLKIRLADGTSVLPKDIFKEALEFWYAFCRQHGILDNARRRYPQFQTRKRKRQGGREAKA